MADLKITGLRQISADEVNNVDVYPLADVSANETRKITATDVAKSTVRLIPDGSIPYSKIDKTTIDIQDGSVVTDDLADGAVTHEKLADVDVVDTDQLFDGAVTHDKLAAIQVVDTDQLFDDAVTNDKLANVDVVNTEQIFDKAITNEKLAESDVVNTDQIFDGAITTNKLFSEDVVNTNHLFDNAVTSDKLAPSSCGTTELKDESITTNKLALSDVVDTNQVFDGAITQDKLASDSVGTPELINQSITFEKLAEFDVVNTDNIFDNAITQDKLAPSSCGTAELEDECVTNSKLAVSDVVDTDQIFNLAVTQGKLALDAVGSPQLIDNACTENKLSTDSCTTSKIKNEAITSPKIFPGAIGTPQLSSGSVTDLILAENCTTTEKIAANAVTNSKLAPNSVDSLQLNISSVTELKLSENCISTNKIINGAVTNQKMSINSIDTPQLIDESVTELKLGTNVVSTNKIALEAVTQDQLSPAAFTKGIEKNSVSGLIGLVNDEITPGLAAGIQYDNFGHIIAVTGEISPDELPLATDLAPGVVSVPATGGLGVSGVGAISINNTIVPDTKAKITYSDRGLVVGGSDLEPADLPKATETTVGGVSVPVDGNLNVADGAIRMVTTGVTPDVPHTKVTCNQFGVVTAAGTLTQADIPGLDVGSIITGQFDSDRIKNGSITSIKHADFATCLMQETNPGKGDFLGQQWFTPSTAQLRVYARGSGSEDIWTPVGFGNLQANNLRWGGTYDADTNQIVSVTSIGTSEGLVAGAAFPVPSDALSGIYLVCAVGGSNTTQPQLSGVTSSPGDWALCLDAVQGWTHLDISAGGGGGGGSSSLSGLLDVDFGSLLPLSSEQFIQYDGSAGVWRNTAVIDGGSF